MPSGAHTPLAFNFLSGANILNFPTNGVFYTRATSATTTTLPPAAPIMMQLEAHQHGPPKKARQQQQQIFPPSYSELAGLQLYHLQQLAVGCRPPLPPSHQQQQQQVASHQQQPLTNFFPHLMSQLQQQLPYPSYPQPGALALGGATGPYQAAAAPLRGYGQQSEWATAATAAVGGATGPYQAAAAPLRGCRQQSERAAATATVGHYSGGVGAAGKMTEPPGGLPRVAPAVGLAPAGATADAAAAHALGDGPHWRVPAGGGKPTAIDVADDAAAVVAAVSARHIGAVRAHHLAAVSTHHIEDSSTTTGGSIQDFASTGRLNADASCAQNTNAGPSDVPHSSGSDPHIEKRVRKKQRGQQPPRQLDVGMQPAHQDVGACSQLRKPGPRASSKPPTKTKSKRGGGGGSKKRRAAASPAEDGGGSTGGSTEGGRRGEEGDGGRRSSDGMGRDEGGIGSGFGGESNKERNRQAQHRFRERQKRSIGVLREEVLNLQSQLADSEAHALALKEENARLRTRLEAALQDNLAVHLQAVHELAVQAGGGNNSFAVSVAAGGAVPQVLDLDLPQQQQQQVQQGAVHRAGRSGGAAVDHLHCCLPKVPKVRKGLSVLDILHQPAASAQQVLLGIEAAAMLQQWRQQSQIVAGQQRSSGSRSGVTAAGGPAGQ